MPQEIEYFTSNDGIQYTTVGKITSNEISQERFASLHINALKTKYVKVIAKNFGKIPSGKPGAGENSWLFSDEIIIK